MFFPKITSLIYLAAALSPSAQVYATQGLRGRQLQGQECQFTTEIKCEVVDIRNEGPPSSPIECKDIYNIPGGCGLMRYKIFYWVCNLMENDSIYFDQDTAENYAKSNGIPHDLDLGELPPSLPSLPMSCRKKIATKDFDSCNQPKFLANFKTEAWVKNVNDVTDKSRYCFAFKTLRYTRPKNPNPPTDAPTGKPVKRLNVGTDSPTVSPVTASPTKKPLVGPTRSPTTDAPTKNPTTDAPTKFPATVPPQPVEEMVPPDYKLDVECFGPPSHTTPCDSIRIRNANDCVQNLKYKYTITNLSDRVIKKQSIIVRDDGELIELPPDTVNNPYILDYQTYVKNYFISKNICQLNGKTLDTVGIAMVANVEGKMSLTKTVPYVFDVTPKVIFGEVLDYTLVRVECFIEKDAEQACEDYAKLITDPNDCSHEVTFVHKIRNDDYMCEDVNSITAKMGGGEPKALTTSSAQSCVTSYFCPDDVLNLYDTRTVDFCARKGTVEYFDLALNDNEKRGTYQFPAVVLVTQAPTPVPSRIQCLDHPSVMVFQFQQSSCNPNKFVEGYRFLGGNRLLGGKHTNRGSDANFCEDLCPLSNGATIIVSDANEGTEYYRKDNVQFEEYVTINNKHHTELGNCVTVTITNKNGRRSQDLKFRTTCSNDGTNKVYTGDTYGALQLVGWKNEDQGVVGHICE